MEGRLGAVLALCFGVGLGIFLAIPKNRQRVKASLIRAGGMTKEGFLKAVDKVKSESLYAVKKIKREHPIKIKAKRAYNKKVKKIQASAPREGESFVTPAEPISSPLAEGIGVNLQESLGGQTAPAGV